MLHGKIFFAAALLLLLFLNGTAMAQQPDADCERAKQYLVTQYSRTNPEENEKYYQIWSSPQCVQARKSAELYVDPQIESNERLIRSQVPDYDRELARIPAICGPIVEKRWSEASEKFRSEQKKSELLTACIRNRSQSLRIEYLHRLNQQSAEQFLEKQRQNRQQIAAAKQAHAERQAAYELKMQEWRDAVNRCKAGEIRYCSPGY